jgi:hypothetical protein
MQVNHAYSQFDKHRQRRMDGTASLAPVIRDLPGVGARLTDHPVIDLRFHEKLGAICQLSATWEVHSTSQGG